MIKNSFALLELETSQEIRLRDILSEQLRMELIKHDVLSDAIIGTDNKERDQKVTIELKVVDGTKPPIPRSSRYWRIIRRLVMEDFSTGFAIALTLMIVIIIFGGLSGLEDVIGIFS